MRRHFQPLVWPNQSGVTLEFTISLLRLQWYITSWRTMSKHAWTWPMPNRGMAQAEESLSDKTARGFLVEAEQLVLGDRE